MANENRITIVINADGTAAIESIGQVGGAMQKLSPQTTSVVEKMKTAWIELYAKIELVKQLIGQINEFRELSAKAEQSQQTFHSVANSFGYDANRMMQDMKKATKGIIDDSDLAQQGLRGLMLGLDNQQIVKLMEAARPAARVLGVEYAQAMEMLITAVGSGVRAMGPLVQTGLITKEMFKLLQEAEMQGIETQGVFNIVVAQAEINMARMGDEALNTWEKMQKTRAEIHEFKEIIGSLAEKALVHVIAGFQGFAAATLYAYAAFSKFRAIAGEVAGAPQKNIEQFKADAEAAFQAADALIFKANKLLSDEDVAKKIKSGIDVEKKQKEIDDYKAHLQGLVDAKKNASKVLSEEKSILDWQKNIEALNPDLDETARKTMQLTEEAKKLKKEYGDTSWISQGLEKGLAYIAEAKRREILLATERAAQQELETRIKIEDKINDYKLKAGEITESQALSLRMENERKVLEGKQELLGTQISLEQNEVKQIELVSQYWDLQEQINASKRYEVFELHAIAVANQQKLNDLERERLEMTKQGYDAAWQNIMNMANQVGGEQGKGMGMMAASMKGGFDIAAGVDPYTEDINKLKDYHYQRMEVIIESITDEKAQEAAIMEEWRQLDLAKEQVYQQQKIQLASSAAGMMAGLMYSLYQVSGQHNKAIFTMYKTFAIAQTTIDTYQAAVAAYKAMVGIPYVGPVLAAIAAATAIAFGMAKVAAISSMQPGGGMSSAGVSGGGGYSYTSPTEPSWKKEEEKKEEKAAPTINVWVNGNIIGNDEYARELAVSIKKAWADGVH